MSPSFTCIALAASIPAAGLGWVAAGLLDRFEAAPGARHAVWSLAFWLAPLSALAALAGLFRGAPIRFRFGEGPHATGHMETVVTQAGPALQHAPSAIALALLLVIATGAALGLIQLLQRLHLLSRIARQARPMPPGGERAVRAGSGLPKPTLIRLSDQARSPMIIGLWRPVLVLPMAFGAPEQAAAASLVCRHEAAHIRRGDNRRVLAEAAIQAVFWFNPLLRLIQGPLSAAREEICDRSAMAGVDRAGRELYARTLVAAMEEAATGLPAAGLIGHNRKHGVMRLSAIMAPQPVRKRPLLVAAAAGLVLSAGGAAVAAVQGTAPAAGTMSKVGESQAIEIIADHLDLQKDGSSLWVGAPALSGKVDAAKTDLLLDGRLLPGTTDLHALSTEGRLASVHIVEPKLNAGRLRIEMTSRR
jgi:beta-lactamase regulating signal transducer with metallopeptidase domain